jgi:hypothetical protein
MAPTSLRLIARPRIGAIGDQLKSTIARSSLGRPAAVDRQAGAGHVAGVGTGEPRD